MAPAGIAESPCQCDERVSTRRDGNAEFGSGGRGVEGVARGSGTRGGRRISWTNLRAFFSPCPRRGRGRERQRPGTCHLPQHHCTSSRSHLGGSFAGIDGVVCCFHHSDGGLIAPPGRVASAATLTGGRARTTGRPIRKLHISATDSLDQFDQTATHKSVSRDLNGLNACALVSYGSRGRRGGGQHLPNPTRQIAAPAIGSGEAAAG